MFPMFPSAFGKFFCRVVSMYLFYCLVLLVCFAKVVFRIFIDLLLLHIKKREESGP